MSRTARILRAVADAIQPPDEVTDLVARADAPTFQTPTGLGQYHVDKGVMIDVQVRPPLAPGYLDALYRQGGYWRRIVDVIPSDACRGGWRVDQGKVRDVCQGDDERLDVAANVCAAWKSARLYGHGVVLMVTDDEDTDLTDPLPDGAEVLALQVYDGKEARPLVYDGEPTSPTYRMPLIWAITPTARGTVAAGQAGAVFLQVHASRLLVFYGHTLPPSLLSAFQVPAQSVFEAYYDALTRKGLIDAAASDIAGEMNFKIRKVSGLGGKALEQGVDVIKNAARDFARQLSVLGFGVIPSDDSIEVHNLSATGFKDLTANAAEAMAAVEGIPITILLGQAPGGMTTDNQSGRETFDRLVAAQQIDVLAPALRQLYRACLRARGDDPAGMRLVFAPLAAPNAVDQAQARLLRAQADVAYITAQVVDPMVVAECRMVDPDDPDELRIEQSDLGAFLEDDKPEPETPPTPTPEAVQAAAVDDVGEAGNDAPPEA